MKLSDYLKDRLLTLCFLGIGMMITMVILIIAGAGTGLIAVLASFFILLVLMWLVVSWYVENKKVKRIWQLGDGIKDTYLLGEMLPEPSGLTERTYFDIMKKISQSSVAGVEQALREKEEYCEYVESYVHEMKTPLTACSLILSNDGNTEKLKRELKKADNLTDTILWYARMKTPEKDTHIERISLEDVVKESVREEMELLIAAGISVETIGTMTVMSDHRQIGFVLRQLLCNAAKYCPGCHIVIEMKDKVLRVEDDGIGIYEYEIPRVTERGFTGSNIGNAGKSTGMGLYLVKTICCHLGVEMTVKSEPNCFTRFLFHFQ